MPSRKQSSLDLSGSKNLSSSSGILTNSFIFSVICPYDILIWSHLLTLYEKYTFWDNISGVFFSINKALQLEQNVYYVGFLESAALCFMW